MKNIAFLSSPEPVNMGDGWFALATPNHFWMQRRFEVFRTLTRGLELETTSIAEIGCGNGVVVQQFSETYRTTVDGFDLNPNALTHAAARLPNTRFFCYNVHDRISELSERYDWVILFDIIEHLRDPELFLESVMFHVKRKGYIAVNVPALPWFFSKYDRLAGHLRRYTAETLRESLRRVGLYVTSLSYWGAPLLPALVLRKCLIEQSLDEDVLRRGFAPASSLTNSILRFVSHLEWTPQEIIGTSVMAIATRK